MPSIVDREYQTFLLIERWLATRLKKVTKDLRIARLLSPWFLFWITIGGFFFGFQSYLLLHGLSLPFAEQTELIALTLGIVIGVVAGLMIVIFFDNSPTDWRLPMLIFGLWMIAPTIFPLLFLVGIFTSQPELISIQTVSWRPIVEFFIFGLGLAAIAFFYRRITFTQGVMTVLLFSFFFIGKSLTSNAFYLAGKCPTEVSGENRAWESNTRAEIEAYRAATRSNAFYYTPVGQLVCTRTPEDLFR